MCFDFIIFTFQSRTFNILTMKIASKILSLLVLVALTVFYVSCGKEPKNTKTEAEKQLEKLKSVWTLQSANDGTDRTADFPNLKLTISGTFAQDGTYNYSFTGTRPNPSPWPVSGTWKFGTNPTTDITRDPATSSEIPMTYTINGTTLEIKFTVSSGSPGWAGGTSRVGSVSGNWTFTFNQ